MATAHLRHLLATSALLLASCQTQGADPIPRHDTFTMQSQALQEVRRITVHTPDGYDQDPAARFAVLYMPDGGIGEDFPHIVATIDELIATESIPKMLVVGIENTERRRDLSGPTTVAKDRTVAPHVGGSEQFRKFIQHELIPEIERRYRCSSARAIVGESLAGLFVVETMLLEPTMFDRYIAISPSLWWNDHRLVRSAQELVANSIGHPMQLFLSHGNETDIAPHAAELARVLGEFAPSTLRVVYEPHPEEQHHTIFRAVKKAAFLTVLRH
jgi:uncharacterized protein